MKVLVAEDEPAMLSLVARHLRRLGFSVTEASDGDAAWEVAQQVHPDLVLLDVMMPGMSGWEVCKHLKGDDFSAAPFRKTGVVMLTGIGDNLNEMTSPLFEADAWLNKPFYFPDLERKIRETLGKYGHAMPIADLEDDEEAAAEEEASLLGASDDDDEDDEDVTDEIAPESEPAPFFFSAERPQKVKNIVVSRPETAAPVASTSASTSWREPSAASSVEPRTSARAAGTSDTASDATAG